MAPTATLDAPMGSATPPSTALSAKSQTSVTTHHIEKDDSSLQTVDELLRSRATAYPHVPIVSYPSSQVEYVDYTYQQLDVFAYRVAKDLETTIPTRMSSKIKRTVVALIGPSNLEYLATMMALIKAGHTVLFLSTRISAAAIESLIKTTGASYLIADTKYLTVAAAVKERRSELQILDMPTRSIFEFSIKVYVNTQLDAALDANVEAHETVYVIHSSGKLLSRICFEALRLTLKRIHRSAKTYLSETDCSAVQLQCEYGHEGFHYPSAISQSWHLQPVSRDLVVQIHPLIQRRSTAHQ